MDLKRGLFHLTPLGRADQEVLEFVSDRVEEKDVERYQKSLNRYRRVKLLRVNFRVLVYAGLITSAATTFGLSQAQVLQRIASYLGTGILFTVYILLGYVVMLYREQYHVFREILVARAASSGS
ncbi:MAG: hypothetical protein ABEK01_02190 [Candidatus Nanohaloarchaea archaeon]